MRNSWKIPFIILFGLLIAYAGMLFAQASSDRPFIVNGKQAGTVVQVGEHSYVALETVAQITKGSVTIEANRVLLNIAEPEVGPGGESSGATGSSGAPAPPPSGLSREFAKAGIAELAEMREWRGAVGAILTYGVPVVGTWPQDYRDHVESNLNQVALAATTDADQDAVQLLRNEFDNLAAWADDVVAARNGLDATKSVNPDAMRNDPGIAKISDCSRFLNSMLVSGTLADNSSCH